MINCQECGEELNEDNMCMTPNCGFYRAFDGISDRSEAKEEPVTDFLRTNPPSFMELYRSPS